MDRYTLSRSDSVRAGCGLGDCFDALVEAGHAPCRGILAQHAARHAAREGDIAPAFELPNTMKELVRLDDYAGAPLVLVFYRGFF